MAEGENKEKNFKGKFYRLAESNESTAVGHTPTRRT